jgi:hypothetical protein
VAGEVIDDRDQGEFLFECLNFFINNLSSRIRFISSLNNNVSVHLEIDFSTSAKVKSDAKIMLIGFKMEIYDTVSGNIEMRIPLTLRS